MSSDNQEFLIPFEESRRGANSSPEKKAAIGRLGRYLGSRAIDRPTIGDGHRNRRDRRRGINIDLPTGGKPGKRKPTGSRLDLDNDGWADEGTTKPVWVGIDEAKRPNGQTPSTEKPNSDLSSGKNKKAKLNIAKYGKNNEYSEVSSFEIDGKTYSVSRGGDAVPGGYNGYLVAFDGPNNIGYIDYQMVNGEKKAKIAMVFTDEKYRRQGIAEALLDSFTAEYPDYEIDPGMTTEDGSAWWRSATGSDGPIVPGKPDPRATEIFAVRGNEQADTGSGLSSGRRYQEIVDAQPPLSEEKKKLASEFSDDLETDEFEKADVYIEETGPRPPRPAGMPEPKPVLILQDEEKRTAEKLKLRNLLARLFEGEMTLDHDVIIKGDNGQELNIGKTVLIDVPEAYSYAPSVYINKASEQDLETQKERAPYDATIEDGDLILSITIPLKIKPLPEYSEQLLSMYNDEDKRGFSSRQDGIPYVAYASRTFMRVSGEKKDIRLMSHDTLFVNERAQGQGLGSAFNARNEQIYKELDLDSVITWGTSGDKTTGAVHWPKNGFSWAGEKDKQDFIGIIDRAIAEMPELFSEEDRKKITSLYRKNPDTGLFETEATAEDLLDFPAADKIFSDVKAQIFYSRPLRELSRELGRRNRLTNTRTRNVGANSNTLVSLSSGKSVSELYDGEFDTWEQGKELTPNSLWRLIDKVFEKNDVDATRPKYKGALEKISDYKDSGYLTINNTLRSMRNVTFDNPQGTELGQYATMQRLLTDNKLTGGITLYRAITRRPELDSLNEGDKFSDVGFQSFSLMAPGQYSGQGDTRPIILRLLTTKNTSGRYVSMRPQDYDFSYDSKPAKDAYFGRNEHEVLLPAGATYSLVKKTKTSDGREVWDVNISNQGKLSSGAKQINLDNVDLRELSSGKPPRAPKTPTLGAFIGDADSEFADVNSWEEFKKLYGDREVIFFDYETTGLVFDEFGVTIKNGAPVQFGAVKIKNGEEVGRINLFMNPKEKLGQWSLDNLKDRDGNPLTDDWLGSQMSIEEAHRQLIEFAGPDALFGVQNATFDKAVLDSVLENMGESWRPSGYLDTREIAALTLPEWTPETDDGPFVLDKEGNKKPSSSLKAITEYLGVELGAGHHNADADAFATSQVMQRIIDGAIQKGWSTDALSKTKRDAIHKASVDKHNAEFAQFEKDKDSYLSSLSSGRDRPVIQMSPVPARREPEAGSRNVKEYNQPDSSGRIVRKNSPTWLKGMTTEEMSKVVVPRNKEEHFEMWADDIAGDTWRTNRKWRKFLEDYYKELNSDQNAIGIDYSPETVAKMQASVKELLDSSPAMRWMFENHGAPMVVVFSRDAINEYENRPDRLESLENLRKQRGLDKRPFVCGLSSREFGLIGLTPRAYIDRESQVTDEKGVMPVVMSPDHIPEVRDSAVDRSIHGVIVHEYGHWLHMRALWDSETSGAPGKSRQYYGNGSFGDPKYTAGMSVAEEYANPDTDNEAIGIYTQYIDLTGRDARDMLRDNPDRSLTATSYGNVNKREAIAEAFVAIMHPNRDMPELMLSKKLRDDIYALAGIDEKNLPWEKRADGRPIIKLSSGRTSKPERSERRGRIARAMRQLVGIGNDEQGKYEKPERPEGLVSFAIEPSPKLRKEIPVPSEKTLVAEMQYDVENIPPDVVVEFMNPNPKKDFEFGLSEGSTPDGRKASVAAKRMISLNISETAQIEPREFIEAFNREIRQGPGFDTANNFLSIRDLFKAIDSLPPDASDEDRKSASRFALDRRRGSIVPIEQHNKTLRNYRYYDEIIDKLEELTYESLFGKDWTALTATSQVTDESIFKPYLMTKLAGLDANKDFLPYANVARGSVLTGLDKIRNFSGDENDRPVLVLAPIGEIDPKTQKPRMEMLYVPLSAQKSDITTEILGKLQSLIGIKPEDRTPEQQETYEYVKSNMHRFFAKQLDQILQSEITVIDKNNIDSDETKQILKNYLIGRMRTMSGDADQKEADYENEKGIVFFDINTPEGQREAKAALISDIIHTWAISANNSNPVALAIQHEVRNMFGLDQAVGWYGGIRGNGVDTRRVDTAISIDQASKMGAIDFDDSPDLSDKQREIIRSIAKAIYDATQHYYKSKGITHIAIWRGMKATPDMRVPRGEIAARRATMRPLSSWTTNRNMGAQFSTSMGFGTKEVDGNTVIALDVLDDNLLDDNLLMRAYVPIDQIFANPLTGFGCLGEDEVVLLGRPTDTLMVAPSQVLLPERPTNQEEMQTFENMVSALSERDRIQNQTIEIVSNLDMKEFANEFNSRSGLSSGRQGVQLSSGKTIKYSLIDSRMRAADMKITFVRDQDRANAIRSTLTKGFMGGFTVEIDRMDDVKDGIAIARNRHGMKVDAVADFDAEGNPSDELVETFMAWLDFHGPKTFMQPKQGAEKTTVGGWVSDGVLYLDVVDVYPNTEENVQRAANLGLNEDQIAVTDLTKLWELIEKGEDLSPAFIDSGGTGGFTLDGDSVRRVSAALRELDSNKMNTGSRYLKRIGNTKTYKSGPISTARRVRYKNYENNETQDYWIISGSNGLVKVFTHEQYLKVRDKKIQDLFDKMSIQSEIFKSMFENSNIKPAASMSFTDNARVGKPYVSRGHKGFGLTLAMGNLYKFATNNNNIGIQMGDSVVAA